MWLVFALAGALFKSLSSYNRKKVSHLPSTVFAWVSYAVALTVLLPFVVIFKSPVASMITEHPIITAGIASTTMLGTLLNVKALSKEELSFVSPLNGFIPVFGLVFGFIFLREIPPLLGGVGVTVIFLGTYVMALKPGRVAWYEPLTYLFKSSAARLSLGVAISYALSTIFVKAASTAGFDPLTILYALSIVGFIVLSILVLGRTRSQVVPAIRNHPRELLAASINSLLGAYLHNVAVSMTLVSYALAVRRFDAIFAVLLGWRFLKESNIRNKLIGTVIILVGSALIVLFT